MIIEKASKHAETQDERAKRLYQVGNVIDSNGDLFLVVDVRNGYALYDLKTGKQIPDYCTTLPNLATGCYDQSDKLVTKLTYETED